MNITLTIANNHDPSMIPSEASGKRKASDDNTPNSNGAPKAKRSRKDNASHKRKLLNGEEQRGGLVIIRGSGSQQPPSQRSSNSTNAVAGPSHPPRKKFRASPTKAPSSRGKHKSPDEDGAVEEDVRRMEMEADELRRSAHRSLDSLPSDSLIPLTPRETPTIEQNRAMRGECSRTPRTPRRASMSSRGKRLSNSFDRAGIITQPHSSVDDASLYKHIDSELPDPDRARQLIMLCAARASLPAPREGKDPPSEPSEKGLKLLQDLKDNVLLSLAERKVDMSATAIDRAGSPANGSVDIRPNEQNVNNRARTTRFKDEIRVAKAEDDAWTAVAQFYNSYQETAVRELEQRQKGKGKSRATSEEDLRISELPKPFQEASHLAASILAKDATGEHNPHSHRWSELLYQTDKLHGLINTAVQTVSIAETDLDRRFTHLSHILHARTQRATTTPATHQSAPALSTYLPPRPADPSESRDLLRALARVDAARPPAQVGMAASRAAREVLRAQDAPTRASERRITPVAPPTPRTPRRPGTPGRGR